VAAKSEIPVVVYNFFVVTSSIDLDSDLIIEVASSSANIIVVKLSCGSVGKVQRLSASIDSNKFLPIGGKANFVLPGLGSC
jgi:4-hydroxy-2-oxoglutarate aldolase